LFTPPIVHSSRRSIYNKHEGGEGCKHTIVKRCDTVTEAMMRDVITDWPNVSTERRDPKVTYPTGASMVATEEDYLQMWECFFARFEKVAAVRRHDGSHKDLPFHMDPPNPKKPNFDPSKHSSCWNLGTHNLSAEASVIQLRRESERFFDDVMDWLYNDPSNPDHDPRDWYDRANRVLHLGSPGPHAFAHNRVKFNADGQPVNALQKLMKEELEAGCTEHSITILRSGDALGPPPPPPPPAAAAADKCFDRADITTKRAAAADDRADRADRATKRRRISSTPSAEDDAVAGPAAAERFTEAWYQDGREFKTSGPMPIVEVAKSGPMHMCKELYNLTGTISKELLVREEMNSPFGRDSDGKLGFITDAISDPKYPELDYATVLAAHNCVLYDLCEAHYGRPPTTVEVAEYMDARIHGGFVNADGIRTPIKDTDGKDVPACGLYQLATLQMLWTSDILGMRSGVRGGDHAFYQSRQRTSRWTLGVGNALNYIHIAMREQMTWASMSDLERAVFEHFQFQICSMRDSTKGIECDTSIEKIMGYFRKFHQKMYHPGLEAQMSVMLKFPSPHWTGLGFDGKRGVQASAGREPDNEHHHKTLNYKSGEFLRSLKRKFEDSNLLDVASASITLKRAPYPADARRDLSGNSTTDGPFKWVQLGEKRWAVATSLLPLFTPPAFHPF